uniref:PIPK domain-containing protein n=1 Tax=Ciona savignyi TaxID=51511 RepID=H2YAR4_CIOSA
MLSIFYPGERITERYDIKGCQIGRYTEPPLEGSNVVVILKEKNLEGKSINLGTQREWFLKQIDIDSKFLQSIEVLDYSLLVGIQPLHKDEVQQSRKLSTVITRTQKSVSKSHSPEEAQQQNRRLLPDYKNELHVLDGTERYFVGIIDFFTRFTLKKRLENAYKKLIYPPLSFSTVHPDVFADRFRKYWDKHTE